MWPLIILWKFVSAWMLNSINQDTDAWKELWLHAYSHRHLQSFAVNFSLHAASSLAHSATMEALKSPGWGGQSSRLETDFESKSFQTSVRAGRISVFVVSIHLQAFKVMETLVFHGMSKRTYRTRMDLKKKKKEKPLQVLSAVSGSHCCVHLFMSFLSSSEEEFPLQQVSS